MVPVQHCREDFYPRSPCGERLGILGRRLRYREQFLSTLSLRRATSQCRTLASGMYDFYPRSPCGERRQGADPCGQKRGISIHALLAESDNTVVRENTAAITISIHALLAESDARIIDPTFGQEVFLSTLSLRRATHIRSTSRDHPDISIHALLAESDHFTDTISDYLRAFLSTLSLRRATALGLLGWLRVLISIHALLAESDAQGADSGY